MALQFLELYRPDDAITKTELAAGLLAKQASIAPKFFYDALGSRLFDAITELQEYYPTRTEAKLMDQHAARIRQWAGQGGVLIDLGAGNCAKAAKLLPQIAPRQYVAVDVSAQFLRESLGALAAAYPEIEMLGVGLDFSASLDLPQQVLTQQRLLFYPGSSIGNFAPADAQRLLTQMARAAGEDGGLMIGVDLRKAKSVLEPAYDDALGVTAAFNKNVLLNVNRWMGANFDPSLWRHLALFDDTHSRIEMHLEAKQAQHVRWEGGQRTFTKGQRIHTENSYKYSPEAFDAMLAQAGFGVRELLTDDQRAFGVWLARK